MDSTIDARERPHGSSNGGRIVRNGASEAHRNPLLAVILGVLKLTFWLVVAAVTIIATVLVKTVSLVIRVAAWMTVLVWRSIFWMLPG